MSTSHVITIVLHNCTHNNLLQKHIEVKSSSQCALLRNCNEPLVKTFDKKAHINLNLAPFKDKCYVLAFNQQIKTLNTFKILNWLIIIFIFLKSLEASSVLFRSMFIAGNNFDTDQRELHACYKKGNNNVPIIEKPKR